MPLSVVSFPDLWRRIRTLWRNNILNILFLLLSFKPLNSKVNKFLYYIFWRWRRENLMPKLKKWLKKEKKKTSKDPKKQNNLWSYFIDLWNKVIIKKDWIFCSKVENIQKLWRGFRPREQSSSRSNWRNEMKNDINRILFFY